MTDEERKEFKSKENKRRSELRRKQLSSMSKVHLDAYRKREAARKKKTVNPTTPEPTEMCKDVTPLSHYRSKQSYRKALKKSLNSLRSSPRKRTSVIAGLAKRAGIKLECQMEKRTRWNPSKEMLKEMLKTSFSIQISHTLCQVRIFAINITSSVSSIRTRLKSI